MTSSIVLLTKNEKTSVGEIYIKCLALKEIMALREILVVDGHSTDGTQEIFRELGINFIADNGKGKGSAIRQAISQVKGDIIVFIDADGSHDPADIPRLIKPILDGECDHVTGSRMKGGSDELHGDFSKFVRMIGSDIITLGINYRFGVRLTDSQNGFRAIRREAAQRLGLKEDITTIEQEMIIKTLKAGFRMGEVATHEYKRKGGESKISVPQVWPRYVYSWLKYLFFN
ncbi:MAG: glycosyltransferase family 2 protein [Desulfarculaceae bacterium]|nr:glycosyltransferase family 2 protein [Desulfarculaceae bacterium]